MKFSIKSNVESDMETGYIELSKILPYDGKLAGKMLTLI